LGDVQKTVHFVPADFTVPIAHHPLSWTGNRATPIRCITADGSFIGPCLVISRKTVDDELLTQPFAPEKAETDWRAKADINIEAFRNWSRDTFIPDVMTRREYFPHHRQALLIMDNRSTHRPLEFDRR
jgi:hypothetical protein